MALEGVAQINAQLERTKHVLVVLPESATHDAIASAIAILLVLEGMGKRVDATCHNFSAPTQLSFLPKLSTVTSSLDPLKKCIITVKTAGSGIKELSYDMSGDDLRIYITPKTGSISREQVTVAATPFRYDTIITVGVPDLTAIGKPFEQNRDFFLETPLINIDFHPGNEHFGQFPYVDVAAHAVGEVVFSLLSQIAAPHLTPDVVTALLTAIIAQTRGFRIKEMKPRTFALAAKLIDMGARRGEIVEHLYRTRTIPMLKLWGRVLSHIERDAALGLVTIRVTRDDFARTGTQESDLTDLLYDLVGSAPEAKLALLLSEEVQSVSQTIHVALAATAPLSARAILAPWNPTGTKEESTCLLPNSTLEISERLIRARIAEMQKTIEN